MLLLLKRKFSRRDADFSPIKVVWQAGKISSPSTVPSRENRLDTPKKFHWENFSFSKIFISGNSPQNVKLTIIFYRFMHFSFKRIFDEFTTLNLQKKRFEQKNFKLIFCLLILVLTPFFPFI